MTIVDTVVSGMRTYVVLADRPRAVLLIRTPYDAQAHCGEAAGWASRGFTTVVQDVRGRYGSAGTFRPFCGEGVDGLSTAEWITQQPWWFDAPALVLYGTSYGGHCAVETAVAAHHAGSDVVVGVSVVVPALGLGETARTPDGAFFLESRHGWWTEHGDARTSRPAPRSRDVLDVLPVSEIGRRSDPPIRSWHEVLAAERADFTRGKSVAAVSIPLLAQGGIADWFAQDTVDLWSSWGGPSALALGPWDHTMRGSSRARRMGSWLDDVLSGRPWTGARVYGPTGAETSLTSWPGCRRPIGLRGGAFRANPLDPFPSPRNPNDVTDLLGRPDCLVRRLPSRVGPMLGSPVVSIDSAHSGRHWAALLVVHRRDGRAELLAQGLSVVATIHLTPVSTYLDEGEDVSLIISGHAFPRHARDLQGTDDTLYGVHARTLTRIVDRITVELPV